MLASFSPTVWATRLLLAFLFAFTGYVLGFRAANYKCQALSGHATTQVVHEAARQQKVTDGAVTRFVDQQATLSAQRAEIRKDIDHEVPAAIVLPAVYRVLHDAVATATVPAAADLADARAVAALDLAETVAENYAACAANRGQLIALQEWVKNEQGITLQ
jgi:hypothetical protein